MNNVTMLGSVLLWGCNHGGISVRDVCLKRAEDDRREERLAGLGYVDKRGSECQIEGQKKHGTFPKWPLYFLLHKIHTGFAISRFVFYFDIKRMCAHFTE